MPEDPRHIFLMPPFPGAAIKNFALASAADISREAALLCTKFMRKNKVGGSFWGVQVDLQHRHELLIKPSSAAQAKLMLADAERLERDENLTAQIDCDAQLDPWYLFDQVDEVWTDADDDLALLAAIAGKRIRCWGRGRFSILNNETDGMQAAAELMHDLYFSRFSLLDPFLNKPMKPIEIAELLAHWRRMIDANRGISAACGFAFWKKPSVAALLWSGNAGIDFVDNLSSINPCSTIATWSSRLPRGAKEQIVQRSIKRVEIEDGFIRSTGLGADCVPPLSIIADRQGIYFDPSGPSELEDILQNAQFSPQILKEAESLQKLIVEGRISKYAQGATAESSVLMNLMNVAQSRDIALVTGQVEDDRSVQCGGGDIQSNLKLLEVVRRNAPDSYIAYKPHPDVEAGHRAGHIDDSKSLQYADIIVRDADITDLIEVASSVHVLTSLAGFEALLRGKPVTTYGAPFYAGWGLTDDRGTIPKRRTARRNLLELLAATLLLYPRYLDPKTGLPCPADILVHRLKNNIAPDNGIIVHLRRLQGRFRSLLRRRLSSPGRT